MKQQPKKSLRETLEENQKAMNFYARMSGKPIVEAPPLLKPKRERAPSVPSDDVEGPVQSAIAEFLGRHPKVLWAVRQNSGAMWVKSEQDPRGKRPVFFYSFVRRPSAERITLTDFIGQLRDGRMIAIEAKKPSWTHPTDAREFAQLELINAVKSAGGIGLFVTDAQQLVGLF